MEHKKFFSSFLFLLFLFKAAAQDVRHDKLTQNVQTPKEQKNYFIKEENKGVVLYQRLSWDAVDDIFGFEFILEKAEKKNINEKIEIKKEDDEEDYDYDEDEEENEDKYENWTEIERRTVKTNYIALSLKPGKYRYKVAVINFLRQREEESEYRNFYIRIAYLPQITAVVPKTVSIDELSSGTIRVNGKNFHEETSFFLKSRTGRVINGKIEEIDETGKIAKVKFNMNQIPLGEYLFTAMDPSGLSAAKPIVFNLQKPLDVYLASGYAFSVFAGEDTFKTYFGTAAPRGGIFRLTIVPIKKTYGNFGMNITLSGNTLKKKHEDFIVNGHFILTHIDAAYIFPIIKKRLSLDIHAGGGYSFLAGVKFGYPGSNLKSPAYWYWGITFNAGSALQVYIYKRFYAEVNIDHTLVFRKGFPKYILQPSISLGYEF